MTPTPEQQPSYSTKHPHEPEIPPALDQEGRCLVCGLLVQLEQAQARERGLREALSTYRAVLRSSGRASEELLALGDEALAAQSEGDADA